MWSPSLPFEDARLRRFGSSVPAARYTIRRLRRTVVTPLSPRGFDGRDGSVVAVLSLSSVILELELGSDGTSNVIAGYLSTFAPPLGCIARRRLRVSRITRCWREYPRASPSALMGMMAGLN